MIAGFFLGLMGSLHCAGMCGPLVLMTPVIGKTRQSVFASRLLYHVGRLTMYAAIGALFGALGESLVFAGFQRWLSISVGLAMIVLLTFSPFKANLGRLPISIKTLFGKFLHQPSYRSIFALGATNGLLPCGLVYMAATASVASGAVMQSIAYMLLFGIGTLPMLLGISIIGAKINLFSKVPGIQKLAQAAAILVAILLIVRAEPLGLFKSNSGRAHCPACRN